MNELGKPTYQHTIGKKGDPVSATVNVELPDSISDKDLSDIAMVTASIEHNLETLSSLAIKAKEKATVCPVRVGDSVDRNSAVIDIDGLYSFPINKELSTLVVTEISVSSRTFIARASSGAIYNMSWDAVGTIVSICQPKDVRVYIPMFGMCNVRVATLDRSSVILTPVNQETSKKYYHLVNLTLLDDTDSKKLKNFLGELLEKQQH